MGFVVILAALNHLLSRSLLGSIFYHTQEKWSNNLDAPVICRKPNAWMGHAYYFWYYEGDALYWGRTFKRKTGYYQVYEAELETDDVLDTVFNEEHYDFWVRIIEKYAKSFIIKIGRKPTLEELHRKLADGNVWEGVAGIFFQDISKNPDAFMVDEFQYKKRIQIAVFDDRIIHRFALRDEYRV